MIIVGEKKKKNNDEKYLSINVKLYRTYLLISFRILDLERWTPKKKKNPFFTYEVSTFKFQPFYYGENGQRTVKSKQFS